MSQRATWETSERLKSKSPNFEKSLMKHYMKLKWVGRKCPASSQAPPNKDFRNHECSYIQFFHWGKGRRLALNSQSLIPGLSHQLSLFCSVFYELSPRLCFVDIQQALYLHQRRNWKYYVYTMFILRFLPRFVSSWELELASNGNSVIGPSQSISQSSQPHKFPPDSHSGAIDLKPLLALPCPLLKSPLSAPQVWAHWRPGACRSRSSVPSCATLCSTLCSTLCATLCSTLCATHGRKSCRCPELQLPLKRRAGASKPQVSPPSNLMVPALVSPPWIKTTMEEAHQGSNPPSSHVKLATY